MFTTHFKMTGQPFQERPPVEYILKDERITQGVARLEYLASQGTIALVAGQTGVGKACLIKLFLHSLNKNLYQPAYIHFTNLKATGLLKLIVAGLGEDPKRGKDCLFLQILNKTAKTKATTILIIDEAHLLNTEALTDLRLLVSSAIEDAPPLKIVLVGQEDLLRQLKHARHLDLVNRICIRYKLPPLTRDQTIAYIDFQMKRAGASDKIFEPEVKNSIYDCTNGIPRQINNIAAACLINAAAHGAQKINTELLEETMVEFRLY